MVAEQINQIVDMVAQKLGVAVEAVYPMLIKQAEVFTSTYHVTLWITGIAFFLCMVFIAVIIWKMDYCSEEFVVVLTIVGILVCGVAFFIAGGISLANMTEYFTALHNPEWWAIEYVTKLVK